MRVSVSKFLVTGFANLQLCHDKHFDMVRERLIEHYHSNFRFVCSFDNNDFCQALNVNLFVSLLSLLKRKVSIYQTMSITDFLLCITSLFKMFTI